MDTSTTDRLTAQYVWAIQSDAKWHEPAMRCVAEGNFGRFRRHTGNYIREIELLQEEHLTQPEWAYVLVALWSQAGGALKECAVDEGPISPYVCDVLAQHFGYGFPLRRKGDLYVTYGGAYTYRSGHKCERSGLRYKSDEDALMGAMYRNGASAFEIADRLQRTAIAICERMVNHGLLQRGPDEHYYCAVDVPAVKPETINQCSEIAPHLESAASHLDCVADSLETIMKENQAMSLITNPNVAIETKTVIFGQDANSMSEQQLIDAIRRVEGDISKLKEVKTSSKKIASNIKELEAQLNAIVAVLDAR